MTEYYIIAIFVLWYVISMLVSENIGNKKKIGVEWSFFISMIFSPVIGYLVTRFSPDK
jgi:hypothetical protein